MKNCIVGLFALLWCYYWVKVVHDYPAMDPDITMDELTLLQRDAVNQNQYVRAPLISRFGTFHLPSQQQKAYVMKGLRESPRLVTAETTARLLKRTQKVLPGIKRKSQSYVITTDKEIVNARSIVTITDCPMEGNAKKWSCLGRNCCPLLPKLGLLHAAHAASSNLEGFGWQLRDGKGRRSFQEPSFNCLGNQWTPMCPSLSAVEAQPPPREISSGS